MDNLRTQISFGTGRTNPISIFVRKLAWLEQSGTIYTLSVESPHMCTKQPTNANFSQETSEHQITHCGEWAWKCAKNIPAECSDNSIVLDICTKHIDWVD